jgi:NADPH-dependent 2,4-dienoyl-CoA reductase/sulfur reductase-like enzyme
MSNRLVVIGGVAAGMSAASKAKRIDPNIEIVVFERNGFTSYGACGLPYLIEGLIDRPEDLVLRTPEQFAKQGITARVRHEVTGIDYEAHTVEVRAHDEGRSFTQPFDKLLIATGANPVRPPIPGIDQDGVFVLRSLEDGVAVLQALETAKRAVVVGGGYVGLEMAEAFAARGLSVAVVEALDRVLPFAEPEVSDLVRAELESRGVEVHTGSRVTTFAGRGRVEAVETSAGTLPADIALLSIGIRANTALAQSIGVDIGPTGAIAVDEGQRASLPGVWAAGDVAESRHVVTGKPTWMALGDVANKQGRVAGTTIAGGSAAFGGVCGTAITKVFELGIAMTGLTEAAARDAGIDVSTAVIRASDRAHYFPGRAPVHVKIVYRSDDGRLVGGHVVASGDSAKRVDVLAALLQTEGTVEDLARIDCAYAPPFSPVWDPLLVAANQVIK